VLIFGHRGASALEPENTLAAFRRARADGADGVELDVMTCASGEVVVTHDEDLERVAGVRARVADLTLPALRDLRLAGGAVIPLLDEVLEELGRMQVIVEIKAPRPLAGTFRAPAVARVLRRHRTPVLVASFNPITLAELRLLAPRVPVALLFHARQRPWMRAARARRLVRPAALHPEHVLVDAAAVARWHAEGLRVNAWTVDDPAELRRLRAAGVDGVITNDPGAARRALDA
jgi:glycerophosphoryl diester phosphodiesterase